MLFCQCALTLQKFLLESPVEKLRSGYWNEWAKKTAKNINCAIHWLCHMYDYNGTTDTHDLSFRKAWHCKSVFDAFLRLNPVMPQKSELSYIDLIYTWGKGTSSTNDNSIHMLAISWQYHSIAHLPALAGSPPPCIQYIQYRYRATVWCCDQGSSTALGPLLTMELVHILAVEFQQLYAIVVVTEIFGKTHSMAKCEFSSFGGSWSFGKNWVLPVWLGEMNPLWPVDDKISVMKPTIAKSVLFAEAHFMMLHWDEQANVLFHRQLSWDGLFPNLPVWCVVQWSTVCASTGLFESLLSSQAAKTTARIAVKTTVRTTAVHFQQSYALWLAACLCNITT